MAFVQLETWRAAPSPRPASAYAAPAAGLLSVPLWDGLDLPLRRAAASAITILVHIALVWFLIARLADGAGMDAAERAQPASLTLFDLTPPGAPEPRPVQPRPAAAPLPETLVDLSRPADVPAPEWSVTRIRAPSAMAAQSAAPGSAGGGARHLRDFIGFGDGEGGELLLDRGKLESARQIVVHAFPEAQGTVLAFLRVSPTGVVLAVEIKGGTTSREAVAALKDALLGQQLFLVRSPFKESALVFLPPIVLGSAS